MSMNVVFVQVDPEELARIETSPALAEPLFQADFVNPLAKFWRAQQANGGEVGRG